MAEVYGCLACKPAPPSPYSSFSPKALTTRKSEKEEAALLKKSNASEAIIDERLLNAYKRIRANVINGLGVVTVERDACGGCFNKIPPQRQLDIRTHKKVIVCEHCGRILVDSDILTGKLEKV